MDKVMVLSGHACLKILVKRDDAVDSGDRVVLFVRLMPVL
jgi:hypothetical protein